MREQVALSKWAPCFSFIVAVHVSLYDVSMGGLAYAMVGNLDLYRITHPTFSPDSYRPMALLTPDARRLVRVGIRSDF